MEIERSNSEENRLAIPASHNDACYAERIQDVKGQVRNAIGLQRTRAWFGPGSQTMCAVDEDVVCDDSQGSWLWFVV